MCRALKVIIIAPAELHGDLRTRLASLAYEIVGTFEPGEPPDVPADVAILWEPEAGAAAALRDGGLKVVAVGGASREADLAIGPQEIERFSSDVWELFRAR